MSDKMDKSVADCGHVRNVSATELLRKLLDERGIKWWPMRNNGYYEDRDTEFVVDGKKHTAHEWGDGLAVYNLTPEQAITATLGKEKAGRKSPPEGGPGPCGQPSDDIVHDAVAPGNRKAKAHPYGYEPDTGAFDVTRCECGCLNDISAKYCNDCGGVIEVDMDAEKEIYHAPRHLVFAEKHDDGSLEFGGKRYVAETSGSGKLTAEQVGEAIERNFTKICVLDDGKPVEWREDWVCMVGIDYKAIADELNELGSEREKKLEKLAWDMWCEITTCPDYRMPPCMTESICERVRNLEIGMDERR